MPAGRYASGSVRPAANAAFAIALWRHAHDAAALRLWKVLVTATCGRLGYRPDAAADALSVSPHLPAERTHMGARRLPFAEDPVDFQMRRDAQRESLRLSLQHPRRGTAWTVTLPALCAGASLLASVDGHRVQPQVIGSGRRAKIRIHGTSGAAPAVRIGLSCPHATVAR